jgi:hypothetical protein
MGVERRELRKKKENNIYFTIILSLCIEELMKKYV